MKNVLLTTTALVAMAGAASAEITFGGSAEIGYAEDLAGSGAFYTSIDLTVEATKELGNGVSAKAWFGILDGADFVDDDYNGDGTVDALDDVSDLFGQSDYGVELSSSTFTLTLSNDIDTASDHFDGDIGAWLFDAEMGAAAGDVVRLDGSFGGFDASVSLDNALDTLAVGVSGSFGNFDVAAAYDEIGSNGIWGVSAGTTFGSASVKAFYGSTLISAKETDFGIDFSGDGTIGDGGIDGLDSVPFAIADVYGLGLDYAINDSMTVGVYYQHLGGINTDHYGVNAELGFGAATVGVYYDSLAFLGSNYARYGIDVDYVVAEQLTISAGYREADVGGEGFYAGLAYDWSENGTAGISYAEYGDAGTPEFDSGTKVYVSFDF